MHIHLHGDKLRQRSSCSERSKETGYKSIDQGNRAAVDQCSRIRTAEQSVIFLQRLLGNVRSYKKTASHVHIIVVVKPEGGINF
jgi:hypothetical protein